jgi:hypothetical protein
MIELAAWVAFILGLVFFADAVWMFAQWIISLNREPSLDLLIESGRAACLFVLSALSMGALACIDRYVFDLPEPPKPPATN